MLKFISKNLVSIVEFSIYFLIFLGLQHDSKGVHFARKSDLNELVIENVTALVSLKTNHTSPKLRMPSVINIFQENNSHNSSADCIGVEQFCQVKQITRFPDKATITLLLTKNNNDSGLIKEIKTSEGIIYQAKEEQINEYISASRFVFFLFSFVRLLIFILCIWTLWKIFSENFIEED